MSYSLYSIWRRNFGTGWIRTSHTVTARSQKQADYMMKRKFNDAAFHSMQLVAVEGFSELKPI